MGGGGRGWEDRPLSHRGVRRHHPHVHGPLELLRRLPPRDIERPNIDPGRFGRARIIDHVVCNVGLGDMDRWAAFYANILGLPSSTTSTTRQSPPGTPLSCEGALGWRGQDQAFRSTSRPPAARRARSRSISTSVTQRVQHMALATDDIVETVRHVRSTGVRFLTTPEPLTTISRRDSTGRRSTPTSTFFAELGILVDQDDEGYCCRSSRSRCRIDRPCSTR